MDLRGCLTDFLKKYPQFSKIFEFPAGQETWSSAESSELMAAVSELLASKDGVAPVSQHFGPLLLNLLHRAAVNVHCGKTFSLEKHEDLCVCLAKLCATYPFALRFALEYFESHPPIFHRFNTRGSANRPPKKHLNKRLKVTCGSALSDVDIVQAAHDFLRFSGSEIRVLWDWAPIVSLLGHTDDNVKWFACLCCCVLFNLSASQIASFLRIRFESAKIRELSIRYNKSDIGESLTFTQLVSLKDMDIDLSDNVANVCGILLPSCNKQKRLEGAMVTVPSTCANLRSLALAVKRGLPVLLQGPIGCGKTAIVEHIAAITGRSEQPLLLKVQLGDQTDSKMLIGTYQCTEVPGEFVWRPGALLTAVEKGYWILLEDIDFAPMDVISMLIPLLETGSISAPGLGRTVSAGPGFQLFATRRRLGGSSRFHGNQLHGGAILDKLFTKISVEPLSISELAELIRTKWPVLKPVVARLLEIYLLTCSAEHEMDDSSVQLPDNIMPADARSVSTRDLLKWCERVADNFTSSFETSAILTFQDALDCFCGSITRTSAKIVAAEAIAARLNITKAKVEYFCTKHKPHIKSGVNSLTIGRVTVSRLISDTVVVRQSRSTFAFTRQASILLEQIAVAVRNQEPVLLVGETGTGKTATVQYLAEETRRKLVVVNMNQHSDSADLLGGFKPIDLRLVVRPLKDEYEQIFCQTFSRAQNATFLGHVVNCFSRRQWTELFQLMLHTQASAVKRLVNAKEQTVANENLLQRWHAIGDKIEVMQAQVKHSESALAFTFVEGSLVRALREGHWILLDEVNLASAETLHCLGGLLESPLGSVLLLERGDVKTVKRHPDFRLFACMNPATDVGKRELPLGIRNRFTEVYMEDLEDSSDLSIVVQHYLRNLSVTSEQTDGIVKFYLQVRGESSKTLTDGTGRKPHYSLRTLCRALSYAAENPCQSTPRSLYEAFCMSFLTQLDRGSHPLVKNLIIKHLLAKQNTKSVLTRKLPEPCGGKHINFEGFWVPRGTKEPQTSDAYILTSSVRRNLLDLTRVVAAGRHPVLLQGDTSVGKTSLVKWLADASGHQCVRVNNHEHTDLQEYVGSYAADDSGRLVFKEGVLVNAMRQGDWIILDELNLAPTDVLEALNRVLDDNRELFITETQETVTAHPNFCLFATQNPPGHYGGRKVLSRAFRNRFVELHFEEIPSKELETILHQRCALPPSYCSKLVAVMTELQRRRSGSGIFAGKQGFITLRDLFRWAERYRRASKQITKFYDWDQHLADEGYLLLAGRVRNSAEEIIILDVLKKHFKKNVDPRRLFAANARQASPTTADIISKMMCGGSEGLPEGFGHLVWTYSMRRLAVLLGQALRFDEPVLMVSDTGCGKTTLCELYAALSNLKLRAVNCHMHSEGADFLGGLRPVRSHRPETDHSEGISDRLFEWVDGPLVKAMKEGSIFLSDEISLADDSVLERLNSVLEPERTLLLAEKGGSTSDSLLDNDVEVVAKSSFRFLATMNPGGDFGKKELSPALRNRFTEIWCPNSNSRDDLLAIIEHNLFSGIGLCNKEDGTSGIGHAMLDFLDWFGRSSLGSRTVMSVRDILAWVHFINTCSTMKRQPIDVGAAYVHGASLVVLDALGSGIANHVTSEKTSLFRDACLRYMLEQLENMTGRAYESSAMNLFGCVGSRDLESSSFEVVDGGERFGLNPFYIETGISKCHSLKGLFAMSASSTAVNALRVLRAMQLSKPILLEGSPGVGKTSLVLALAKASGHEFVRINLSEQTDISDLFGADLPVEGGQGGQFAWRDGPFLRALKLGHWVVLDELNLASQSVLEGLNAFLDHRAEVYVPELGRTFGLPPGVKRRIFACQNPLYQGGARKGLPRSFLNRFTQVYVEPLSPSDLEFIATVMFPTIPPEIITTMVKFNQHIYLETVVQRSWGTIGGPWEVNLRDIFRWCELITSSHQNESIWNPSEYVGLIYADRMRTKRDKQKVYELCGELMVNSVANPCCPTLSITRSWIQLGHAMLPRASESVNSTCSEVLSKCNLAVLPTQLSPLRSLMKCIEMNWTAILVGPHACGKTALVTTLSQLTGSTLQILNMNSDMDTTELLGGFEQVNLKRHLAVCSEDVCRLVQYQIQHILSTEADVTAVVKLTSLMHEYQQLLITGATKMKEEAKQFQGKIEKLYDILDNVSFASNCVENVELLLSVRNKLKRLEEVVKAEDSLNCGGRFEWVDSLLVKALQNGHWLLIDNVNFCSPSVLDRLNALLEPNGVLTISERGVINGEIPTIVPHPNFRLILAMDPQSGEISRAMRNRGVEIFLHGELEDLHFTEGELCTILANIGLSDVRLQHYLIRFHREIGLQFIGDALSFSDLLRAAQLTVQHIQEGFSVVTSLSRSCSDVYVRCRYLTTKKALAKSILAEVLSSARLDENASTLVSCYHHLAVSKCRIFPELATVQQEMIVLNGLLELAINDDQSATSATVWYFEKFNKDFSGTEESRIESVLATALAIYLLRANACDWALRLSCLNDLLRSRTKDLMANKKSRNLLEKFMSFAVNVSKEVASVFEHFLKSESNEERKGSSKIKAIPDVGLDPRWNPELSRLWTGSSQAVSSYSALANRFSLLLKDTILNAKCGKLSSFAKFDEINFFPRVDLVKLFDLIFLAIAERLKDSHWLIGDDRVAKCESALYVLHRAHCYLTVLFGNKRFTMDDQLQLRLHLRDLFGTLFPLFFGANWELERLSGFPHLFVVYRKISSFMRKCSIKGVNQHATKLSPILGSPKPFRGILEANIHCSLNRLWSPDFRRSCLNPGSSSVAANDRLLSFYFSEEGFLFRRKMCTLLLKEAHGEEDQATLESLEKEFKCITSTPKVDNDGECPSREIGTTSPIGLRDEVLPVVEHLAILQEQHSLCLMTNRSKMDMDACSISPSLSCTVDLLSVSISATPAHLVAVERLYHLIRQNEPVLVDDHVTNVLHIQRQFYEFCIQSARVTAAITEARDIPYSSNSPQQSAKCVDYVCRPQLSILVAKILSSRTSNLELGFCEDKANQLYRLSDILWTNAAAIGSSHYNPRLNDAILFTSHFCGLAKAICTACGAFDLVSELEDSQRLNEYVTLQSIMARVPQRCSVLSNKLRNAWLNINFKCDAGLSWMHLGWLRVALLSPIFEFDPAEEQKFQLRFYQEEIYRLEEEIHVVDNLMFLTLGCTLSICHPSSIHPRITFALGRLNELKSLVSHLEENLPHRPSPSQYEALRKEFVNYWTTVASKSLDSLNEWNKASSDKVSETVSKIRAWLGSQTAFLDRISTLYPLYRDLTQSCCLGILQMMHGASLLMHKLEVAASCDETGIELSSFRLFSKGMFMFPYCPSSDHGSDLRYPALLISKNMLDNIQSGIVPEDARSIVQILKSSILELKNQTIVTKTNDLGSGVFETSVTLFATIWHAQEERRREKEAEDEKTFTLRPREHGEIIDDEKQFEALVKKTFPTYRELFEDLVPSDTLSDSVNQLDEFEAVIDSEQSEQLSTEDIHAIVVLYKEILTGCSRSRWFSSASSVAQKQPDVASPLLTRYPFFAQLIGRYGSLFENGLDSESVGGHLLYVAHLQNKLRTNDQSRSRATYNFYRDSNVAEVTNGQPILRQFSMRVEELLAEWPDHPTLKQLLKLIDRILNFSVTSPVMKFITGFETLLGQAQEWEKNAHKGVSLLRHLKEVTDQIIRWRKMEIGCWSSCLNSIEDDAYAGTSRWWLHLYRSMQLPSDETAEDLSVLKNVLQTFIEKSPLGEFKGRLELMFSLACFFTKETPFTDGVLELVWNVCEYYRQYVHVVDKFILQLRTPIEKRLKEFIKIARWNDLNFWAVKQSVDKSHRTLLKHMHQYEVALRQSMQAVFVDEDLMSRSETKSVANRSFHHIGPRANAYFSTNPVSDLTTTRVVSSVETALNSGDLFQLLSLRAKARRLCKKLVINSAFDQKIRFVDEFVGDVIDCVHELQALEVNKSASKEKQISEAKNINLRKRKALADLFKRLTRIGLSYRKGLIGDPPDEKVLALTPIDVEACFKELRKNKAVDDFLLESWRDCPRYLHRSLARMALMRSSLQTPTKELGPANIHRCQGYSAQLLMILIKQREQLAPLLGALSDIRFVVDQFLVIGREEPLSAFIVPQVKLRGAVGDIKSMVANAYLCLQQFRVLLESCPAEANGDSRFCASILKNGQERMAISDCRRKDMWWTENVATTDKCIESLEHLRDVVFRADPSSCLDDGVHSWHSLSAVNDLLSRLQTAMKLFPLPLGNTVSGLTMENPLTSSVFKWREVISTSLERTRLSLLPSVNETSRKIDDIPGIVRALVTMVLKAIENLVKLNANENDDTSGNPVDGREDVESSFDDSGLLTIDLHGKLKENVDLLKSKLIRDKLMELYCAMAMCANETANENLESAQQAVCLVEQYLGLAQYYLVCLVRTHRVTAKMSSVLLGLFIELVRKGFCVPAEYSNEIDGERSTKFEDNVAGTGIGEGEGLKDVSDRIENEDQLEEAFQEGTERKEDDDSSQKPDLEDEEHGIEMSDDFDAKVHDLEKEDADDEDDKDENNEGDQEELEKQMGDLNDEDAEKLDEKIWGDEDDDDEDEEAETVDKKEDEYGEGDGPQEETRIVAKEDNKERGKPNEDDDDDVVDDDDDGKEPPADDLEDKGGNVNMIDEREFDDKQNYSGDKDKEHMQEPEDMDLPEDLDLDGNDDCDNDEEAMEADDVKEDGKGDDSSKEDGAIDETEATADAEKDEEADIEGVENGNAVGNEDEDEVNDAKKTEIGLEDDDPMEEPFASKAAPSRDKPTEERGVEESGVNSKECSADVVDAKTETTQASSAIEEESTVNDTPDENVAGIGLAETENKEGHSSSKSSKLQQASQSSNQAPQRSKDKLGKSNEKRSLGSVDESNHKRLRTEDADGDEVQKGVEKLDEESTVENEKLTSELYRHIPESEQHYDGQTLDAATENQASKQPQQPVPNREDEEGETLDEEDDIQMMEDDDAIDKNKSVVEKKPILGDRTLHKEDKEKEGERDDATKDGGVVIEGERIATSSAQRGPETTFHTSYELLAPQEIKTRDLDELRRELEEQLQVWKESKTNGSELRVDDRISVSEAQDAWRKYEEVVDRLSRDLCEQLRLILEPSLTAKLKGDYRTGKRLNMRKVIPYVASQFRKDKIWLRRTKPSKREYQILLAMDDSSSMADNHSKQLAFEAMALICNSLVLLEAGEIGVASFGETVRLLHPLGDPFSDRVGAELLRQFTFGQQKTRVGMMLDVALSTMLESRKRIRGLVGSKDVAQLLVIVSDGRGLFNDGVETVKRAVRRARESNLFTVFVVVDNPANRDSILDIRVPVFKGQSQLPEIKSYMDDFPFPFYILLRDINGLPAILSDALRQWFELVASAER